MTTESHSVKRTNNLKSLRIISLLVFLITLSFSTQGQPAFNWHKLKSETENLLRQNGSVGASIIVVNRDSALFSQGFGYANLEHNFKITDCTLFVLGSITKTFTSLGILKLVEEGKLSLDDEVIKLTPDLPIKNKWAEQFPVKVYHLLEHTSGFDEFHLKDRSIPVLDDEFPLMGGIHIVKNSLKTRWQPGTRFAYSNVGYLVAGYLIEKVSGRSYNDFMLQEVLKPLKMTNSSIRLKDIDQDLLAKSFAYSKEELPFKHVFTRPTASLISSAKDMGQFLQIFLNQGDSFLNTDTFDDFERHHSIKAFDGTKNGYRLGIYPRFHKGREWLGH